MSSGQSCHSNSRGVTATTPEPLILGPVLGFVSRNFFVHTVFTLFASLYVGQVSGYIPEGASGY